MKALYEAFHCTVVSLLCNPVTVYTSHWVTISAEIHRCRLLFISIVPEIIRGGKRFKKWKEISWIGIVLLFYFLICTLDLSLCSPKVLGQGSVRPLNVNPSLSLFFMRFHCSLVFAKIIKSIEFIIDISIAQIFFTICNSTDLKMFLTALSVSSLINFSCKEVQFLLISAIMEFSSSSLSFSSNSVN